MRLGFFHQLLPGLPSFFYQRLLSVVEITIGQRLRKHRPDRAARPKLSGVFRDQGVSDRSFHAPEYSLMRRGVKRKSLGISSRRHDSFRAALVCSERWWEINPWPMDRREVWPRGGDLGRSRRRGGMLQDRIFSIPRARVQVSVRSCSCPRACPDTTC